MAAVLTQDFKPLEHLESSLVASWQAVTRAEHRFLKLLREFDLRRGWEAYGNDRRRSLRDRALSGSTGAVASPEPRLRKRSASPGRSGISLRSTRPSAWAICRTRRFGP